MRIDIKLQTEERGTYNLIGNSDRGSYYRWRYSGSKIKASAIPEVFDGNKDSRARESYAKECLLSILNPGEEGILTISRTKVRKVKGGKA